MTASACLCHVGFIVARGFSSTETHTLTSNFSSVGEIIRAQEKRDFKPHGQEEDRSLGGKSESDPFYGPQAGKLLK